MKNRFILICSVFLFNACIAEKQLYSWEDYDLNSYNYLKDSDSKSIEKLKESYKKIISNQTGVRGIVPPGIYADYGFILLIENNTIEAKAMLLKEIELYPESRVFIQRILNMIDK